MLRCFLYTGQKHTNKLWCTLAYLISTPYLAPVKLKKIIMKVSMYKNLYDTVGAVVPLDKVLLGIREGRWGDVVSRHRAGAINAKMNGELPAFTVGGVFFPKRRMDNMTEPSGLMSFDLDGVTSFDRLNGVLMDSGLYDYVYSDFQSLGGKGLCLLVRYDATDISSYQNYYAGFFFELEKAVGGLAKVDWLPDLNRLRFVSHDPSIQINTDSKVWTTRAETAHKAVQEPRSIGSRDSLLESDEQKLIQFALEKYTDAAGLFGSGGITRHDWILGFGRYLCRAGVSQSEAEAYCVSNFVNIDRSTSVWHKEIERCIRSSYERYGAEMGSYAPTKRFDYNDINQESTIDGFFYQLLLYTKSKENLVSYLRKIGKETKYAQQEVLFLTTLYKKLSDKI
jgi:hypothetical protein